MDRARKVEPRSNKLLYEAELRFRKDCHDRKLRAVKSSVDNGAPKGFGVVRWPPGPPCSSAAHAPAPRPGPFPHFPFPCPHCSRAPVCRRGAT